MDIKCKKCNSSYVVKNGFVRDKQRYKCTECKYNFVEKDKRIISDMEKKKALSILLYSQGKGSFRFIANSILKDIILYPQEFLNEKFFHVLFSSSLD